MEWQRNDEGDIIDPPTIAVHERRINDAAAAADPDLLAYEYSEYEAERRRVVEHIEGKSTTRARTPDGSAAISVAKAQEEDA